MSSVPNYYPTDHTAFLPTSVAAPAELGHIPERRRVILLEPLSNSLDTSSLERHGRVSTMFGSAGSTHQTPSVHRTDDFMHAVRYWCHKNDYDPEYDLFVIAGRATKVAVALLAIQKEFPNRTVHTLMFDGGAGQYVEREL